MRKLWKTMTMSDPQRQRQQQLKQQKQLKQLLQHQQKRPFPYPTKIEMILAKDHHLLYHHRVTPTNRRQPTNQSAYSTLSNQSAYSTLYPIITLMHTSPQRPPHQILVTSILSTPIPTPSLHLPQILDILLFTLVVTFPRCLQIALIHRSPNLSSMEQPPHL